MFHISTQWIIIDLLFSYCLTAVNVFVDFRRVKIIYCERPELQENALLPMLHRKIRMK
jgi:hypothetical protein